MPSNCTLWEEYKCSQTITYEYTIVDGVITGRRAVSSTCYGYHLGTIVNTERTGTQKIMSASSDECGEG